MHTAHDQEMITYSVICTYIETDVYIEKGMLVVIYTYTCVYVVINSYTKICVCSDIYSNVYVLMYTLT